MVDCRYPKDKSAGRNPKNLLGTCFRKTHILPYLPAQKPSTVFAKWRAVTLAGPTPG